MKSQVEVARTARHMLFYVVAAASLISPAFAQNQPSEPEQTVIVTGTRIVAPNATSASPIQVISSQEIQATGKTDISDIINQLPQNLSNDLGQDLGNRTSGLTTAGGVATADLRGLGPNRTLVLLNGRRLGQGSPYTFIQQPGPDLDQIPTFLLERVDVLTGGASAVYGSDAIAGVVNFVLKRNFQGLQFNTQFGETWHDNNNGFAQSLVSANGLQPLTGTVHDGKNRTFDVIAGTNFAEGNGNITAYFSYRHADPVSSGQRDFGQCQFNETFNGNQVIGANCGGSSNSNWFQPYVGGVPGANVFSVSGNGFVPIGAATTPPAVFNSQPFIYMSRQDDRYLAGFLAHDELTDWAQPYAEFGFMNDRTHQAIAPSALFKSSNPLDPAGGNYYVNCGNPFLSSDQQIKLGCTAGMISGTQSDPANWAHLVIGRRNIEGGGRTSDYEHTNYRGVLGMKGAFLKAWNYDAYAQYYYTTFFSANNQYLNFQSIDNALIVTDPGTGPACVAAQNGTDSRCVPYNIFSDGGVTQASLNYLYTTGTGAGTTTLRTYHTDVTGALGDYGIKSPLANEGVDINVGYEHRNENVQFAPDAAELSGLLSGFGSAAVGIDNTISVDEESIELRAPLLQDKAFAKDLIFGTGYRHSNYSSSGGVNTYKFDLQYSPIEDLRFRGSYQRAIRAPNIIELFNPQLVGLIQFGNDPCAPPAPGVAPVATLAQCLHTVSAADQAAFTALYKAGTIPQATAGQLSQLTGGNPNLQPETAKTYSLGVGFTPAAVPNLTGSIDWWQIKLKEGVGPIPASIALSNCLATGDPTFCAQIVRSTNSNFSLTGNSVASGGYIVQTAVNVGAGKTSGVDLQTNYKMSLPSRWGSLLFTLNGSYLLKSETTPLPGFHTYDCAGLFGLTCQTINPRWRHNMRTTWASPWDLDVSLNWRFIGKVALDNNAHDPSLRFATFGDYDFFNARLPNFSYVDLSAVWHGWKTVELRGGINNLLDKDPPLGTVSIVPGGAANTWGLYDQVGREMYISATARF